MDSNPGAEPAAGAPLTVRPATAADAEQIVRLCVEAFDGQEEWGVRAVLGADNKYADRWFVAVDGDRVVATLCLLSATWRLGSVLFPVGQIEYVATDPEYRNRGLIRSLMDMAHARSDARGDLLIFIGGIAYYYRQFGYEYALAYPGMPRVVAPPKHRDHGLTVRPVTRADEAAARSLHAATTGTADLAALRSDEEWDWYFDYAPRWLEQPLAVEDPDGIVVATATLTDRVSIEGALWLRDVCVRDETSARVLIAHALDAAAALNAPLEVLDRPGTEVSKVLEEIGAGTGDSGGVYARTADPIALLDRWRPVLDGRLAASAFAGLDRDIEISLYRYGITLECRAGRITAVRPSPADPLPDEHNGIGVAPDLIVTLLLGRYGAAEMQARHDDVIFTDHTELMDTLFPKLKIHVLPVL